MVNSGELNQKRLAMSGHGPMPSEEIGKCKELMLTLTMLHDLAVRLQEVPLLYDLCDNKIRVLFRNSQIDCDGFLDDYKEIMAVISIKWPVIVYGVVDNQEVGELRVAIDEIDGQKELNYSYYNVSGKSFNSLSGICMTVDVACHLSREFLKEAIHGIGIQNTCILVHQKWQGFCAENELPKFSKDSGFCYLLTISDGNWLDMLHSISITQKEELWQKFLEDSLTPVEFQWLLDAFNKRQAAGLLEWELALRVVLCRLGIKITNEVGYFHVEDAEGKALRFQFNSKSPAEKMFLKILFPIGHY